MSGTISHSTKFSWAVMLSLLTLAFFMGATYMRVEKLDEQVGFIYQQIVNSKLEISQR